MILAVYQKCLTNRVTFDAWTLEDFCNRLQQHSKAEWISLFIDRYLAFDKITKRLEHESAPKG